MRKTMEKKISGPLLAGITGLLLILATPTRAQPEPKFAGETSTTKRFNHGLLTEDAGRIMFIPEMSGNGTAAPFHPGDTKVDLTSKLPESFAAALGKNNSFPTTVYQTKPDGKIQIEPRSVGALKELLAAGDYPTTQSVALRVSAENWTKEITDYHESFVGAFCSPKLTNRNETIKSLLKTNLRLQNKFSDGMVKYFQTSRKSGFQALDAETLPKVRHAFDSMLFEADALGDKGVYGSLTIFKPKDYLQILTNVNAVGRIQRRDSKKLCGSCVHIGMGYFLTASHVLKQPADEYEVVFLDSLDRETYGPVQSFQSVKDFMKPTDGQPKLDLVVCKIEGTNILGRQLVFPKRKLLGGTRPMALDEGTPLYVIGFPDKQDYTLAIHDDCKVVLPRWVSTKDIKKLFVKLTLRDRNKLYGDVGEDFERIVNRLTADFKAIYGFDLDTFNDNPSPNGYWAKFGGMPVMGLDSDTFGGDSGGAVFDKEIGNLVGIFCGGNWAPAVFPDATAATFEYAIPIECFWSFIATNSTIKIN